MHHRVSAVPGNFYTSAFLFWWRNFYRYWVPGCIHSAPACQAFGFPGPPLPATAISGRSTWVPVPFTGDTCCDHWISFLTAGLSGNFSGTLFTCSDYLLHFWAQFYLLRAISTIHSTCNFLPYHFYIPIPACTILSGRTASTKCLPACLPHFYSICRPLWGANTVTTCLPAKYLGDIQIVHLMIPGILDTCIACNCCIGGLGTGLGTRLCLRRS